MLKAWFAMMVELSVFSALIILLVAGIGKWTGGRYRPQWRYWIWLVLALRLAFPIVWQLPLPQAIPVPPLTTLVLDRLAPDAVPPAANLTGTAAGPVQEAESHFSADGAAFVFSPDVLIAGFWIWLLGAVCCLVWRLLRYRLALRSLRAYSRPAGPREQAWLSKLKEEMGIKGRIGLYHCPPAESPMLIGYIRPAVLLPDTGLTDEPLALILRHELTHAKRKDLWFMALLTWVSALHWFNPFVHWMTRLAYDDLEKICDSRVIQHADVRTRQAYADAILHYMKHKASKRSPLSTSFLGGEGIVKERFRLIFQNRPPKSSAWISCLLMIVVLAGGVLVSCQNQSVQKQDKGFAELYASFGSTPGEVLTALSLNAETDTDQTVLSADSKDYLLKKSVQVHGHTGQLQLGFYHDALMALQYRFNDNQAAFEVSKALREEIAGLHGKPGTIEGHPNRLDALPALPAGRALPADYLEEWSIAVEPRILTVLFGDTTRSVNVELRLSLLDESHAAVSVRYSVNRNSLQTPL